MATDKGPLSSLEAAFGVSLDAFWDAPAACEQPVELSIRRNRNGTFAVGNDAWRRRSRSGRHRKFQSADALEAAVVSYFEWIVANPLHKERIVVCKGTPILVRVPRARAMTVSGLCLHIGISHRQWNVWKRPRCKQHRTDLFPVIAWAEAMIWDQKFTGAAAGIFNARIISRELGLRASGPRMP